MAQISPNAGNSNLGALANQGSFRKSSATQTCERRGEPTNTSKPRIFGPHSTTRPAPQKTGVACTAAWLYQADNRAGKSGLSPEKNTAVQTNPVYSAIWKLGWGRRYVPSDPNLCGQRFTRSKKRSSVRVVRPVYSARIAPIDNSIRRAYDSTAFHF